MKFIKILSVLLILLIALLIARNVIYNDLYRLKYKDYIVEYSEKYNVNPYLVMAMVNTESKFNKNAVSPKGAIGLMQMTKSTAKWVAESIGDDDFKIDDLYDPQKNIEMGVWYIHNLKDDFGTTELALAAYNAGRGNVEEWLADSDISNDGQTLTKVPYKETENYLKKVLADEQIYRLLYKIN